MREYVLLGPARQIEPDPVRQEPETRLREIGAALASQHRIELFLERMQVKHVGRCVGDLRIGQLGGAPIGELLLLGQVNAKQFGARAVEVDPTNAEGWIVLGAALESLRDRAGARDAYTKCAELGTGPYAHECKRLAR